MAFIITDSGEIMEGTILTEEEGKVLDELVQAIKSAVTEYIGSRSINSMRLAIINTARLSRREGPAADLPTPLHLPLAEPLAPTQSESD